jgi:hypothetical protein
MPTLGSEWTRQVAQAMPLRQPNGGAAGVEAADHFDANRALRRSCLLLTDVPAGSELTCVHPVFGPAAPFSLGIPPKRAVASARLFLNLDHD